MSGVRYIKGNFNFKDRDYKIYCLFELTKYKLDKWHESNQRKFHQEFHDNAKLIHQFKENLITKFASEPFDELAKYTHWAEFIPKFNNTRIPYKKDYIFNQHDIGMDILEEECSLVTGYFKRNGFSIAVPLTRPDIIEWIDANVPKHCVKLQKRIV